VIAFVLDHVPQGRPAHVEHGLAVAGVDLPGRRNVPDEHRAGAIDDGAGILVEGILAAVRDLGVDGLYQTLFALPLRLGEPCFLIAVEAALLDRTAVAGDRRGLQPRSIPTTLVRLIAFGFSISQTSAMMSICS
jgi:hypothetical protein